MPIRINCPFCKAVNSVDDDERGRKVSCRKCEKSISVPAADSAKKKRAEAEGIQSGRKITVKAPPSRRQRDEDEDDERETERSAKRKKSQLAKKGGMAIYAVVGAVAVLLLCVIGGAGVGGFFMLRTKPVDQQAKIDIPNVDGRPRIEDPEPEKKPPVVDPNAGKALPDQMAAETVDKVKQATVYLNVTMPGGQAAEGSGFFAVEPGIIITNAHVLGMLRSSSPPPNQVDVVLNSGLAGETKMIGQVLGVDRDSDLAVVRVDQNNKLPVPLAIETERQPIETQKVFIFGFPFGTKLGKNITVSVSNISSFRPKMGKEHEKIQVNGGMHPGNSGGPVVNAFGNLVGVSVAGITGTQINFAVPSENVRALMEGGLAESRWGEAYAQAGKPHLPVQYKCLDPLGRIRDMRVEVWTGPPGPQRPGSAEQPKPMAGDSARQTHVVAYQNGIGKFDVPLPALNGGEVYWVQPIITNARGKQWGPAQASGPALTLLERAPANLTINLTAAKERTSKMTSVFTTTLSADKKKLVISERTNAELLEVVFPEQSKGVSVARIRSAFGAVGISVDRDGKKMIIPRQSEALSSVRSMPPTFVIDSSNATHSYVKVGMSPTHPLRDLVDDFNDMIHNPYEAATVKMPNRVVQPMETFPAKSTMMFRATGRAMIVDLMMTCTYEGKRLRDGRDEAVLTVVGQLQGRKDLTGRIQGNITGKVGFDLAGGYLSLVQLKILADNEEQLPGGGPIQRVMEQDIEVTRAAGNPKLLALGKEPTPGPGPIPSGKQLLNMRGLLTLSDSFDSTPNLRQKNARMKIHAIPLLAGKTYVIALNSSDFDPYLRLEDPFIKQQVAEDDDSGGNLNALIVYTPTRTGLHRIIVTCYDGKLGQYHLTVQEVDPGAAIGKQPKGPPIKGPKGPPIKGPVAPIGPMGGLGNPAHLLSGDSPLRPFTDCPHISFDTLTLHCPTKRRPLVQPTHLC